MDNTNLNKPNQNMEMGWDDTIQEDGQELILLDEGDYNFIVTNFERGRFPGGQKIPACLVSSEDYDFYNGEDEVSSVLGSLFRYYEKFSKWENAWEDYVDLGDEERNQVLAAAYKQYMLNRVTEAVKSSLEAYREYNKPWE